MQIRSTSFTRRTLFAVSQASKDRLVAFLGEEECVLGRAAVTVGELPGKSRVLLDPRRNARSFGVEIHIAMARLEVIDDAEEYVNDPPVDTGPEGASQTLGKQCRKPELSVAGE